MSKYFRSKIILLLILLLTAHIKPARAQQANAQIQRSLSQERQNIINQKDISETSNIKESRSFLDNPGSEKNTPEEKWCFVAEDVMLEGSHTITSDELTEKFLKDLPKCLSKADLVKIKTNIEKFYIDRGYINARVYFDRNDLKKNILTIKIYEGQVGKITLKDNSTIDKYLSFRNQTKLFTAFPFLSGEVFNLKDFEQGLDQINRLQSSHATMDVRPADADGQSDIIIINKTTSPTDVNFIYDNSGRDSTGLLQKKIHLSQDNSLGLNDNLYINYSTDSINQAWEKYSNNFYGHLSIPFGYWTSSLSYSNATYLTTSYTQNSVIQSSGQTQIESFKLDRVLDRNRFYKIKLGTELDLKDVSSYQNNIKSIVQSHQEAPLTVFLDNTIYATKSTIYLKPSYTTTTKLFGAERDPQGISTQNPHLEYQYFKLYGYYNRNFKIPETNIPLNYNLSLDSQYSLNSLYNTEQFNIGGQYTVRGFNNNNISGDNGYNVRNDLKVNVMDLMPTDFLKSKAANIGANVFGSDFSISSALHKTFLSIFYDYGYVRSRYFIDATHEGYMSGAGTKLNYVGKYLKWDLTYSRGLHAPEFIENVYGQKQEVQMVYFSVSVGMGLF